MKSSWLIIVSLLIATACSDKKSSSGGEESPPEPGDNPLAKQQQTETDRPVTLPPEPILLAPLAPSQFLVPAWSLVANESPTLTWESQPDAASFEMAVGSSSGSQDILEWTDVGQVTTYQFSGTGLTEDCSGPVFVALRAKSAEGLTSDSVNGQFRLDLSPPVGVTGLVQGGDAVQLASENTSWDPTSDACALAHYEIAVSATADDTQLLTEWISLGNTTEGQVTEGLELLPETDYYTLVVAVDAAGRRSSQTVSAAWRIPTQPASIADLSVGAISSSQVQLAWTVPDGGSAPVADFFVEYRSAEGDWTSFADGLSPDNHTTLTGLTPATSYFFRVRPYNGTYGAWSAEATAETAPDVPFLDPEKFQYFNLSGATESSVVAFEADTEVKLNSIIIATLQPGEAHTFPSAPNDLLESSGPVFVAGRLGDAGAGDQSKGNVTWSHKDWAAKEFLFNGSRDPNHQVTIRAIQDTTVEVFSGETSVAGPVSLAAGDNHTFSLSGTAAFHMVSTHYVIGYIYSQGSAVDKVSDPMPLIPMAKDLIGFPSSSGRLSTLAENSAFTAHHSDGTTHVGVVNAGVSYNLSPKGTSSLYQSASTRVISTENLLGNSLADSNGYCSAPFLPVALMRKRYAINVGAEWVALASTQPGVIKQIDPSGIETDLVLAKSGSDPLSPYRVRIGSVTAGTRFESSEVRFAAWYEPNTSVAGADNDETLMYGVD